MNKFDKEILKVLLDDEAALLKDLQKVYSAALADIKRNVKWLMTDEMTQSKIYQLEYQQVLEKRIDAILDVLNSNDEAAITTFLSNIYNDSFYGVNYVIQQQGIPLLFNISDEEVLLSVLRKTGDMTFAQRLGKNMSEFKRTIKNEISRGIAAAEPYTNIAKNLSSLTQEEYNKSRRIAITESGRVQSEAKLNIQQRAKARGANIMKEWSCTFDGKTRHSHRELDGQVREIDEYFEVNGVKTLAPCKFGKAAEDINCRCALLTRAKWNLDSPRMALDNEANEIIEAKNYKDWQRLRKQREGR